MALPQITIFGGSGFLGRQVVKRLAARGYRIRVGVRRPNLAPFLQPLGMVGQIVPIQANVRDDASTARAVAGADIVVNLVGLRVPAGRQSFDNVHVEAAGRVARLAAQAGVRRLIHVSLLGAAADAPTALSRSKAEGEAEVRDAMPQAVILRPALMFGLGDHVLSTIASLARVTPVLPLAGAEAKSRPVYVGDVAEAIVRVIETGAGDGLTYELAGPHTFTWRALVETVLRTIGRRRLLVPAPRQLGGIAGAVAQRLPGRVLGADEATLLASDWLPAEGSLGLGDLGVAPTAAELILPTYLGRFAPSDFHAHTAPL